jgi:hypothetical protein
LTDVNSIRNSSNDIRRVARISWRRERIMKSDVIAKHLLADHNCSNCNHYTTHKMLTIIEDATPTDDVQYSDDGQAYKMFDIDKCTDDIIPMYGVCEKWEKKMIQEGLVWGDLMPSYTTHIFEKDDD